MQTVEHATKKGAAPKRKGIAKQTVQLRKSPRREIKHGRTISEPYTTEFGSNAKNQDESTNVNNDDAQQNKNK